MKNLWFLCLLFPILALCGDFSDNELLITLHPTEKPNEVLKSIGAKNFESIELYKNFFKGPLVVEFDRSMDIEARLKLILKNPLIAAAQLNYKYSIQSEMIPNDPLLKNQWEHQNGGIKKLWNETTDCSRKIIAVFDTGVNFSHPDLRESYGGFGFNAISPEEEPKDFNGHGTLIASIIGAKGNNELGGSGLCWSSKIIPIKVLNELGEGYSSDIIKGISFALKNKVSVLNLSFGSYSGKDLFLEKALKKSLENGAIAVVPAGNDGLDTEKTPFWPCSFKLKGMLCVASSSPDGTLAEFSNFGEKIIDLAAPGENIFGIAAGAFEKIPEDLESGWLISKNSEILGKDNCLLRDKKVLAIPSSFCNQRGMSDGDLWAKKDFGQIISNFDFSYVQFFFKGQGNIILSINGETAQELENEQSDYFLDLAECKGKSRCVLEFKASDLKSKVAIWDIKIWGLKLGNSTYQRKFGSSLSAAYVSGIAALIGSFNPKYSPAEIINSLKEGSKFSQKLVGKIIKARLVEPYGQIKFLVRPKLN
jgi:subtilisin family serine protease